ncbi:sterol desaturase family protein [Aliagarivorans marinus]|uniref:sterol desaturase family protein n=1 Tax=Aliagarivorans marinus TaxID=561965 RepID=UPI0003F5ABCB|nr:sterol desaturase family protein [Aliagarivorans marinus]
MDAITIVRITIFLGLCVSLLLLEARWPKHNRAIPRSQRWPANFAILALGQILTRLLLPLSGVGLAWYLHAQGWGLGNWLSLHPLVWGVVCVLLLDALIYWQHRLFHRIPWLWRLHRVHHVDQDFDVSLALRFHPIEIVLSQLLKLAAITLLGAPALAVVVFEMLLNGMAMFNHANLALPERLERWLRYLVVTPDMHRIHHSQRPDEHHRNFGFSLSCWDRLFASYRHAPREGQQGIQFGLKNWPDSRDNQRLLGLLLLPFRKR